MNIRKQLSKSALLKAANAFCLFFIVKLAIQLSGVSIYGQWLTILSVLTWFSCIEVGFSRAIRNKLTTLLDQKKTTQARELTASIMAAEAAVFLIILLVGIAAFFINRHFQFFPHIHQPLGYLLVFGTLYFIQYVLQMSNVLALSNHSAEWPIGITFLQNILVIIGLYTAIVLNFDSLFWLGIIFSGAGLLSIFIGFTVYFNQTFQSRTLHLFSAINLKSLSAYRGDIIRFGVIQFFVLIVYTTDHLIIQHFVSNEAVTRYNTAFKYFNLLNVLFNLVLVPFWAAFSKARSEQNIEWEKKALKSLIQFFLVLTISGFLMVWVSNPFYDFWLNGQIKIDQKLSFFMLISVLLTMWNFLFTYYLGGVGKVKAYAPYVIASGLINMPLSIIMVSYYQETGVIISTCISLLPQSVFLPLLANKSLREAF